MKVHKFTSVDIKKVGNIALALGFFDAIHIGHQKIINKTINAANKSKLESAVLTFTKSPKDIIEGNDKTNVLSISDKEKILKEMGVDHLIVLNFEKEDLLNNSPEDFVKNYLMKLGAKIVVCGTDYRYGKNKAGIPSEIPAYSQYDIKVLQEEMVLQEGFKISSTKLKLSLKNNNLVEAKKILGRDYAVWGIVRHGHKIGRELGFKTANIDINDDFTILLNGVFAVRVNHAKKTYYGVANVGTRPTFENRNEKAIEVFMFEFDDQIYNHTIKIEFAKFIRKEIKFDSPKELSKQIHQDVEEVKKVFQIVYNKRVKE